MYTMITPALRMMPAHSRARDGRATAAMAQATWNQATTSMNTPNSQYSWKCSPETAK